MTEINAFADAVRVRAGGRCELCGAEEDVVVRPVPRGTAETAETADQAILLCPECDGQVHGRTPLDPKHWFCLQASAWSEVPAVQVVSFRLLTQLASESWAADLRDQLYLDDELLAWAASTTAAAGADAAVKTVDSNGATLADGDSVTLIKDLDVKGAGFVAKRGTLVKNIRLTDDPEHVDGRVNKVAIVLKTRFLKKAL